MPRRRPSVLRQAQAHRPAWRTVPHVPGLPAFAQQEISQIELWTAHNWARYGLWPGAAAEAPAGWTAVARDPARREFHPCGCCGRGSRTILQEALDRLTIRSASALAALIEPLDEQYRSRTWPNPRVIADKPWWERRIQPQPSRHEHGAVSTGVGTL